MDRASRFPIRRYARLDEMKADEYAYWQEQPAYARMEAVTDMTLTAFGIKQSRQHAPRLQRIIQHIKR
jgi:hypothetical protein